MKRRLHLFINQHANAGIPNLMLWIVVGTGALTLTGLVTQNGVGDIFFRFALIPQFFPAEWWRIFTFFFVPHGSNLFLIAFTLFIYYWMGNVLEQIWGRLRFNLYYFTGALCTIVFALLSGEFCDLYYVNLSLTLAFATLFPDRQVRLYFVIPIKMKYVGLIGAGFFLYYMLQMPLSLQNLLPLVAIFNYFLYFGPTLYRMVRKIPTRSSQAKRTVEFRSAVRQAKAKKGYLHKCAICGKTDAEHPEVEFRYCSLCAGYQCYCAEHLFDHDHITMQ